MYIFVKIYPSAIQEHSFIISTLIPSLKKIRKGMPKKESENQFLRSIKCCNSVLICQNLPICNPRTLLPNINSHSKFEENWLKNAPSREWKDALTDGLRDIWTDTRRQFFKWTVLHNTPHFLKWRGIKSADPDEMQHNAAFHQGLHCLFTIYMYMSWSSKFPKSWILEIQILKLAWCL